MPAGPRGDDHVLRADQGKNRYGRTLDALTAAGHRGGSGIHQVHEAERGIDAGRPYDKRVAAQPTQGLCIVAGHDASDPALEAHHRHGVRGEPERAAHHRIHRIARPKRRCEKDVAIDRQRSPPRGGKDRHRRPHALAQHEDR
jgi:hypothetical protein